MNPILLSAGLAAGVLSLPATSLASTTWELDMTHSTVGFVVRHMTVTNVRGQFNKATGTLELADDDPTRSTIDVTIDAASVDTNAADRDKHLRSDDFLDVTGHPLIHFKSKQIKKAGARYKVIGALTIRGVTRDVVLDVTAPGPVVKDPFGLYRTGFVATTKINRKHFGVKFHQLLDSGGLAVGDDVAIQLELQFTRKPPSPTAATAVNKQR